MIDPELRNTAARAAMASMGGSDSIDPFVLQEESNASAANAGHHGWASSRDLPPWTFANGWLNCRLQIGYNSWLVSPDLNTPDMLSGTALIEGTNRTDNGFYVVEVDVSKDTAKIMLRSEVSHNYPVDPEASVVYIDIGYVQDGVQKTRIPTNPVVYKYV